MNRRASSLAVILLVAPALAAGEFYFPSAGSDWSRVKPSDAGWNKTRLQKALDYAGSQRSTGVVILHKGKLLAEEYWELPKKNSEKFRRRRLGKDSAGHSIEDVASAQKSVASVLVGMAQEKGLLKISDPVNKHLKPGWSRASREQEDVITIRHLLTMTSGLTPRLAYETKPGTKWLYNTAAYARSMDVVAAAAKMDRNDVTRKWLSDPLGMKDSKWISRGVTGKRAGNGFGFATSARDLARFGLMVLAQGEWNEKRIVSSDYLQVSTTSSQRLNPYYGYLWWTSRSVFHPGRPPRPATAPADMIAAKGALNRRCFMVPSMDLVVTRLGDQPPAGRNFDRQLWRLLTAAKQK